MVPDCHTGSCSSFGGTERNKSPALFLREAKDTECPRHQVIRAGACVSGEQGRGLGRWVWAVLPH